MEWPGELEELQREACSLEKNPRMGDLLGSSLFYLWDKTVRLKIGWAKVDNSFSGWNKVLQMVLELDPL